MIKLFFKKIMMIFKNKKYQSTMIQAEESTHSILDNQKSRYNPQRTRNMFSNLLTKPFKLSRSKLEDFLKCKVCFYLDRKLGTGRPSGYPFNLNIAVDTLLKKEFDIYREKQEVHPYCVENNINAIPYQHDDLDKWRDSLHAGVEYNVPGTNILFHGGVDDIWIDQQTQEIIIVDYKATSKKDDVTIDADWQNGYKRQIEIYQWLLRKNGFKVSNIAYFIYCNGDTSHDRFDKKLNFKISLLPYNGDDSWVEQTVLNAYACLQSNEIPQENSIPCDYCQYRQGVNNHMLKMSNTISGISH